MTANDLSLFSSPGLNMHFKSCDTQLKRNEDCFADAKAIKQDYMFFYGLSLRI